MPGVSSQYSHQLRQYLPIACAVFTHNVLINSSSAHCYLTMTPSILTHSASAHWAHCWEYKASSRESWPAGIAAICRVCGSSARLYRRLLSQLSTVTLDERQSCAHSMLVIQVFLAKEVEERDLLVQDPALEEPPCDHCVAHGTHRVTHHQLSHTHTHTHKHHTWEINTCAGHWKFKKTTLRCLRRQIFPYKV